MKHFAPLCAPRAPCAHHDILLHVRGHADTIIQYRRPRPCLIPPHDAAVDEVVTWAACRRDLLILPPRIVAEQGIATVADAHAARLLASIEPHAARYARKFSLPADEIKGESALSLIKTIFRFNPDRGSLDGYADRVTYRAALRLMTAARRGKPPATAPSPDPAVPRPAAWVLPPGHDQVFASLAAKADLVSEFARRDRFEKLVERAVHKRVDLSRLLTVLNCADVAEAAKQLGLKPNTLRAWLHTLKRLGDPDRQGEADEFGKPDAPDEPDPPAATDE